MQKPCQHWPRVTTQHCQYTAVSEGFIYHNGIMLLLRMSLRDATTWSQKRWLASDVCSTYPRRRSLTKQQARFRPVRSKLFTNSSLDSMHSKASLRHLKQAVVCLHMTATATVKIKYYHIAIKASILWPEAPEAPACLPLGRTSTTPRSLRENTSHSEKAQGGTSHFLST